MKNLLTQSNKIKHEYCCTVVRIGELHPIEGKDKIVSTLVNGLSMVVRKDQVKEGDLMIYAMNETQLSDKFLAANNLYEIGCYEKNSNAVEVGKLLFEGKNDEAKQHVGFFNKHGRVRLIRLGGVPSFGYLFKLEDLAKAYPEVAEVNLDYLVDTDFDTVCGEEFVKAYVPPIKEATRRVSKMDKAQRKLRRFKQLIDGQFQLHYETKQLARYIQFLNPKDIVTITTKCDGTSSIIGNVLTRKPRWGGWYLKVIPYLPKFLQFTKDQYDIVYSSRKVIINEEINPNKKEGWNNGAVQKEITKYANLLGEFIPKGMTIYSEIVGYYTDTNTAIQRRNGKDYDYGCYVGTNKIMPYRITSTNEDGTKKEWEVMEVSTWTIQFMANHPELAKYFFPLDVLYHGPLYDLYPELEPNVHWHENLLEAMKNDKKILGMELDEPLCKNKVPREGVILRVDGDVISEAFKLKSNRYFFAEQADIDKGILDVESEEGYV